MARDLAFGAEDERGDPAAGPREDFGDGCSGVRNSALDLGQHNRLMA